jgi:hypothetical protein
MHMATRATGQSENNLLFPVTREAFSREAFSRPPLEGVPPASSPVGYPDALALLAEY